MSDPRNNHIQMNTTFQQQRVLNHVPRNDADVKLALTYLDKYAPDLVPMILGGVL